MKNDVSDFLLVIFIIRFSAALPCPCSSATEVCVSSNCLKINTGKVSCSGNGECADQIHGGCIDGFCKCDEFRVWSIMYEKCLVPNDSITPAAILEDCMYTTRGAIEDLSCICTKGTWTQSILACGVGYGSACDGVTEFCFDMTRGDCDTGKCKCRNGYRFKFVDGLHTCKVENMNSIACTSLYQCYSDNSMAECKNSKCVCKSGAIYSTYYGKCGKPNDGKVSCSNTDECLSNALRHGLCFGTCICTNGYMWDEDAGECLAPNNGKFSCTLASDCYGFVKESAICMSGFCICNTGLGWNDTNSKCECNLGRYYSNSGTCELCAQNYYKNEISNAACNPCPPNSFSLAGATSCTCNPGYYYDSASNQCERISYFINNRM